LMGGVEGEGGPAPSFTHTSTLGYTVLQ
jgi:hypothetical protein